MAKVALSFMAMGALWNVAMTMLMGGNPDDDESYYNVNEFSRYNNLIIPTGGKTYIKTTVTPCIPFILCDGTNWS